MKTLLLLAGRSRRFWPLSEKTLFPICGKTLLEHQVARLRAGGCDDIVLVGGAHNIEAAKRLFPDLTIVEQEELELGMCGALLSALPSCGSEPVMIVSGNDVIDPSGYKDLIEKSNGADGALLAQKVDRYFPGGYLEIEGDRITSIVEKPGAGKEPGDLVNIVAHIHSDASALLDLLKKMKGKNDDEYEQALDVLFKERTYRAVAYEGSWNAVKYPWHIITLLASILEETTEQSIDPSAEIHPSAVISGNVVIDEGAKVMAHASVVGPCYIGKNSIVANNALVRGASVGENCVVGFGTEVKASVLHSHVWTHMTYIGDSVIGRNVAFGGGCITGNFRLDEGEASSVVGKEKVGSGFTKFGCIIGNDSRIGISVGTNPGVKIGAGSFVAGGTFVKEDVPDKSFVCMKRGEMDVRENTAETPQPEEREHYRKMVK